MGLLQDTQLPLVRVAIHEKVHHPVASPMSWQIGGWEDSEASRGGRSAT